MSKRLARSTRGSRGPRRAGWGLVFWFAAGLAASVPLVLAAGAIRGAGEEPAASGGARRLSADARAEEERHRARGRELLGAERYADAFEEFSAALRIDPGDAKAHWGAGQVYEKLDFSELAARSYRRASRIDPTYYEARKALGMVLYDMGKNTEALEIWREAEKERPDDTFVWAELAINLMRLGKPGEAAGILQKYTASRPRDVWGHENLGRAYVEAGEKQKAEASFRKALSINPRSALSHLWLGQLLVSMDRKPEAGRHLERFRVLRQWQLDERLLEQAVNREPGNVASLVRLADVRVRLGQYARAMIPLEKARRLAPKDKSIRGRYEQLRRKLGARPQR